MAWNKEEIFEILADILGDNADGVYISYDNVDFGAEDLFYSDRELLTPICNSFNARVAAGMTRLVIIPNDKDYVIKLPITGVYGNIENEYDCRDIEECEVKMFVDLDEYNAFESEQLIYNSLFSESKKVFLLSEFVGDFQGIPVYVQEKVTQIRGDIMPVISEEESLRVSEVSSKHLYKESVERSLEDDFILSLINFYGEEATGWILEDCKNIDDLHYNNYGYTKDGRPVIFDFAGFDGEMYEW